MLSFYVSHVHSKKTVAEILIKNNFSHVKCSLKEFYGKNFEFLHVKHPFKENYRKNFD